MGMALPCSVRHVVARRYKKSELRPAPPHYPERETPQIRARETSAKYVVERRRKTIYSQALSRLMADTRSLALVRRRLTPWLGKAEKTLNRIAKLESNWDGYGAGPISPAVIREARELIATIAEHIDQTPTIVPTSRGAIQLEWHGGSRCLELEFESQAMIHYLKWDPVAGVEEEDLVSIYADSKTLKLLEWFQNK